MSTDTVNTIEKLKEKHELLKERRTRLQVELESASKQLNELKAEAKQLYGTDELEDLRTLYKKQNSENKKKLEEFSTQLDQAEKIIKDVEEALSSNQS